jgi:hypothetical protein
MTRRISSRKFLAIRKQRTSLKRKLMLDKIFTPVFLAEFGE